MTHVAMALVVLLVAGVGWAAEAESPSMVSATVTGDYHDARRWLFMGDTARQFEEYDLALLVYQRVIERFPDTRWARTAQAGIARTKMEAAAVFAPWDPAVGGTPAAVQAQRLLRAGDTAYAMEDMVIALKFYERAQYAAPDSRYARRAASKMRWIRQWKNPGP